MIAEGATFAGRYRLERLLGRGGMGTVWVARDEQLMRTVAIKFMADDAGGDEAIMRFRREAAAAAQLRTRHVVAIHDHGIYQGTPFIVMELLEGESLSAALRREQRLSVEHTASIVMQLGRGLACAHDAGIVHRDLKPQNIFLARDADGSETVKILDFGVAKFRPADTPGESTKSGVVLGSPHYMSPEQARGTTDIDARADLWSVGVILYRALTGQKPWESVAVVDLLVRICTEPIVPATALVPALPPELDAFFTKALAVKLEERFASIEDLVESFLNAAHTHDSDLRPPFASAPSLSRRASFSDEARTPPGEITTLRGSATSSGQRTLGSIGALRIALVAGAAMMLVAIVAGLSGGESTSTLAVSPLPLPRVVLPSTPVSQDSAEEPSASASANPTMPRAGARRLPRAAGKQPPSKRGEERLDLY